MKFLFIVSFLLFGTISSEAQMISADIGVDGLTCSMCARGTEETMKRLSFIDTMWVDLNSLVAHIRFKQHINTPMAEVVNAVNDAGFTVRNITATVNFTNQKVHDGDHITVGNDVLNFEGLGDRILNGPTSLHFIDKPFISKKEFHEWSQKISMKCYLDGKLHDCCPKELTDAKHLFHVTIKEKS